MSFYNNPYYHSNKVVLSILGIWPYQSRLWSYVNTAITLFFICSLSTLELWGLIAGISDLSIIMENLSSLLIHIMILSRMLNGLINKYKFKDLLDGIKETWDVIQTDPENEIFRNYAERSRMFTKQYAVALYSWWIFSCSVPSAIAAIHIHLSANETYEGKFFYHIEHVIDLGNYYKLLLLHMVISVFYTVSIVIAVDSLFVCCIQHICALFEIIRISMEHIRAMDCVVFRPNVADDEAYGVIVGCIKTYIRALKFSDMLSSAYATSLLFLLVIIVLSLSFNSATVILLDLEVGKIIIIIIRNFMQLMVIYILSLMSQQLLDYSSGIQEVIYSCEWYKISLKSRHLLRFTLLRAQKPCEIKAGKLFVMSIENFSSILQTSLSYFMVLLSLQ
ncbi:hypothetical protein HN011_007049 [Eciton burchellii]|nr:hypothetical protein HN011_007049 [Eciton burchellii]